MARWFSIKPGMSIRGRKFKGLRGWAGKPLHPPLTDLPIAAYVLVAVFDVVSFVASLGSDYVQGAATGLAHDFFVAGTYVIIAGAIASLGAAVTGFWDWWKGVERSSSTGPLGKAKRTQVWRTINWHATVMLTVTAIVIVDIIVRLVRFEQGFADLPVTILSLVSAALVSFGAAYGGSLVYDYQFNVESLEGSTVWDETDRDQMPADKPPSGW
jgi:uncharacterized membrane protein